MYRDKNGDIWYKVQLHMHTTVSDGKRTPREAAEIYKKEGFDIIAFTDHWRYQAAREISGVKVLSGCEYNFGTADTSAGVMHIVGIGMDEEPALERGKCSYQDTIDAIRAAGGMAVLAHPAWSLNTTEQVKSLRGFESLEIYNSVSNLGKSSRPYSGFFVDLLANEGIFYPLTATDDVHEYGDDIASYIMVKAKSTDKADILDAIRRCDFYATQGPRLTVKRIGDTVVADCSECVQMIFFTNFAVTRDRMIEADGLTHGEYKIKDTEKWVRVEVMDKDGKYAWSSIIAVQ